MVRRFSSDDRARISAAIEAAERRTSGQFVACVAHVADHDVFAGLFVATFIALVVPALWAIVVGRVPVSLPDIQLGLFVLLSVGFAVVPSMAQWLVPKALRRRRAQHLARAIFHERGVHATPDRSGVLFFVAMAERYVEIIADQGIHERVGEAAWSAMIGDFVKAVRADRVIDGLVAAITACGDAMASHYPARPGQPNPMPDALIELD